MRMPFWYLQLPLAPSRLLVTGGTSVLYFSCMILAPNAFYYAPVLLPFALGNGLTASLVYACLDASSGGPLPLSKLRVGPVPIAGTVIGAATAVVAPFTYPNAWMVVWPESALLEGASTLDPMV
ncbi:hypothetical protein TrRE_jg6504, partial [Triparma retinervis]